MGALYVARDPHRTAIKLPFGGTRKNPDVFIPFYGVDRSEMDELIRGSAEKQGLSGHEIDVLVDAAEEQYERRVREKEASNQLHMRMRERARFPRLLHGGLRPVRKLSQHYAYR